MCEAGRGPAWGRGRPRILPGALFLVAGFCAWGPLPGVPGVLFGAGGGVAPHKNEAARGGQRRRGPRSRRRHPKKTKRCPEAQRTRSWSGRWHHASPGFCLSPLQHVWLRMSSSWFPRATRVLVYGAYLSSQFHASSSLRPPACGWRAQRRQDHDCE